QRWLPYTRTLRRARTTWPDSVASTLVQAIDRALLAVLAKCIDDRVDRATDRSLTRSNRDVRAAIVVLSRREEIGHTLLHLLEAKPISFGIEHQRSVASTVE